MLAMLKNRLPFAVPDWRVANAELVAYPMLEDSTAMVIQPGSSTPDWVVPQDSEVFAESFATALAALHAVPISAAVDAGMLIRTPTQARQKVADDVDRVRREFVVNDKRLHGGSAGSTTIRRGQISPWWCMAISTWAMCSSTTRSASAG